MGACLSSAAAWSNEIEVRREMSANVISVNGDLHQYAVPLTVSQILPMEFPDPDQDHLAAGPLSSATATATANNNIKKFFVCNSDCLYYDDYIPAMDAEDHLQPDQIYFVLPSSKLQHRLTASDMAALAVKASLALQKSNSTRITPTTTSIFNNNKKASSSSSSSSLHRRRQRHDNYRQFQNKTARISPVLDDQQEGGEEQQQQQVMRSSVPSFTFNSTSTFSSDHRGTGDQQFIVTVKKKKGLMSNSNKPAAEKEAVGVVSPMRTTSSVRKLQRFSSRRAKMAVRSFRLRLSTIDEGSVLQTY